MLLFRKIIIRVIDLKIYILRNYSVADHVTHPVVLIGCHGRELRLAEREGLEACRW